MFRQPLAQKKTLSPAPPTQITNTTTHFLALSKPGSEDDFLDLLEIEASISPVPASTTTYTQRNSHGKFDLHYDEEWLAILRSTSTPIDPDEAFLTNLHISPMSASTSTSTKNTPLSESLAWVQANITAENLLSIPHNMQRHAPIHSPNDMLDDTEQPQEWPNAQTETFCKMLGIWNPVGGSAAVAAVDVEEVDDGVVVG